MAEVGTSFTVCAYTYKYVLYWVADIAWSFFTPDINRTNLDAKSEEVFRMHCHILLVDLLITDTQLASLVEKSECSVVLFIYLSCDVFYTDTGGWTSGMCSCA